MVLPSRVSEYTFPGLNLPRFPLLFSDNIISKGKYINSTLVYETELKARKSVRLIPTDEACQVSLLQMNQNVAELRL